MSAAVSMRVSVEELLNAVKPHYYFAVWRSRYIGVQYTAVEPDTALATLPGDSVRVTSVRITTLDVAPPSDISKHPRVRWLTETVGKPPAMKTYQYTFTPLKTRVIERLDTGAEFHEVTQEPAGSPVAIHVVHAYYVAYVSNSRRVYSETPGGARAYRLAERGTLKPPQVYIHRHDKHRYEIGVRIPLDDEQARQLVVVLGL